MRVPEAIRVRVKDERGQALLLALGILTIGLLLALAAVAYALSTGAQGTHDERTRAAQQAADAGVQQQLYDQADTAAVGYNLSSGLLGATSLLDCAVPEFSANVDIGTVQVAASNGVCPLAVQAPCSGTGTTACTTTTSWMPLANGDYYQSEFFPNAQPQTTGQAGSGAAYSVEFPEVVSVGCHTTVSANPVGSCNSGSSANAYAKQLAALQPTAPLQSVEAGHNVAVNALGPLGVIEGNITAGNNISLPLLSLDLNLNKAPLNAFGSLLNGLTLTGAISQLQDTFEYGNGLTGLTVGANTVHTGVNNDCQAGQPSPDCLVEPAPFTVSDQPTPVGSVGMTSSNAIEYTDASCGLFNASKCNDLTYDGSATTAGDLYVTGGTLQFNSPGTYVFCNFYAANTTVEGPVTGSVQLYILAPNAAPCKSDTTSPSQIGSSSQGNFYADQGINNATTLRSVTEGIPAPSAFQIYVSGNPLDQTTLANNPSATPTTSVQIATAGAGVAQAYVVDAPLSNVTVGGGLLSSLAFEGNAIGWNVTLNATVVLQDLDLGNYPLSSVINNDQAAQTVQCANTNLPLTDTTADLSGC